MITFSFYPDTIMCKAIFALFLLLWMSPTPGCPEGVRSSIIELPQPAFEVERRRSKLDRPARAHRKPYKGPIGDILLHIFPPRDSNFDESRLKGIVKAIRDSDVELAIFSPTPNDGRRRNYEYLLELRRKLRDLDSKRIKLFCGSDYITFWLHGAYSYGYIRGELEHVLNRLSKNLDSGANVGVGEVGLYHFNKTGDQPVIQFPPNFEPFVRVVDLIAKKGTWLYLHAEPVDPEGKSYEEKVFGGLELLYRRNSNLKLILSHTAMTNSVNARSILIKYPNVMMNIKVINVHKNWKYLEPITNPRGELYADWAKLFEKMPERFMVGTDAKFFRRGFYASNYKKRIKRFRRILGTLNRKTAKLIAYENAQRLFGKNEENQ